MMALHGQLSITILTFACALFAAGAKAQEAETAVQNGGGCPNAGMPFGDALSMPHWNGWGVDSSQHRFQPSMMARLAPDEVPRLRLRWVFGPRVVRAFAQPTIVGGCLFVGSRSGKSIRSTQ